jgi:hypothetical protein
VTLGTVKCPQVQRCDVKEVTVLMTVITVISPVAQHARPMSSRAHVQTYELPLVIRLVLTVKRTGVNEHLDILFAILFGPSIKTVT